MSSGLVFSSGIVDFIFLSFLVMWPCLFCIRIAEGDQFFLYLRNLPEKVAKHCQLIIFCHFLSSLEVLSTHGQGWEEAGLAKLWFSHV